MIINPQKEHRHKKFEYLFESFITYQYFESLKNFNFLMVHLYEFVGFIVILT